MAPDGKDPNEELEPRPLDGWWSKRFNRGLVLVACGYVALGALALFMVPAMLLHNWLPDSSATDQGKLIGSAAQLVLIGLGGVIAVVGVTLSIARHRVELETQQRDRERLEDDRAKEVARRDEWEHQRQTDSERELRSRFVTTVELLSDESSIKRTAALYALGALADDWAAFGRSDEVQVCIDVLCGYLRAPWTLEEPVLSAELAVRKTGFNIISAHLSGGDWGKRKIDLNGAQILNSVSFKGARISEGGTLNMSAAEISGFVSFDRASIDGGNMHFIGSTVSKGGEVSLRGATIRGGHMLFTSAAIEEGTLTFSRATITDNAMISLDNLRIGRAGRVDFDSATVKDDGGIRFGQGGIKGILSFARLTVGSRGLVMLGHTAIDPDSKVSLRGAKTDIAASIVMDGIEVGSLNRVTLDGATISDDGPVILPDGTRVIPAAFSP